MTSKDFNYELIKRDYELDELDMFQSDEKMYNIKEAIKGLNEVERKIFLTYVELGSYSAVARVYNVSSPTVKSYLMPILNKIKNRL